MDLTRNIDTKSEITLQPKELQRLSEWIHCICVVTFDLELGQAMEVIWTGLIFLHEICILYTNLSCTMSFFSDAFD